MTRIVLILAAVAVVLTVFDPSYWLTPVVQVVAALGIVALALMLLGQTVNRRRYRPPRSQIAEIERLYFRAMREMLTDFPNYAQVANDLQRILSIDSRYKNARHYMQRAVTLQHENGASDASTKAKTRAEFNRLQDQLIELDPGVRKAVVMDLIQFGDIAVDPLIALLMDEDADVRVHAATALGWIGGPDAVQPLLVALVDEDIQVRRYAARALCWVIDSAAVDGLVAALDDEDSYVRCYAARALGWSQERSAIEPLTTLLNDENADVREYAATALLDLGQRIAV